MLDFDGERIADSTDIVRLLEARFPPPRLVPVDPHEQALVHFLEDWADASLYFYEMHLRFTLPHNAKRWVAETARRDGAVIGRLAQRARPRTMLRTTRAQGVGRKPLDVIVRDLDRHFRMLEQWLDGRQWLVGSALTLADIAVFVQLDCLAGTREGLDLMRGCERLNEWMARVDAATRRPGPAA